MEINCPKCQSNDVQLIAFSDYDDEDIPRIKRMHCDSCLTKFDIDLDTNKLSTKSLINIVGGLV
jgi:transcriptional regulator NrdR family protein